MTLWRYVSPLARAGSLATAEGPANAPADGTVLFADVSGFTELMATQASRGASGVERLTETLNRCFAEIIEVLSSRGGEVIGFAGDALLARWPGEGGSMRGSALLAAVAALELQRHLNRRDVGDGVRLTLRIAVSTGPAHAAVVPVGTRKAALLAGAAVDGMKPLLSAAQPGEVMLGATARSLLGDSARATARGESVFVLHGVDAGEAPLGKPTGSGVAASGDPRPYLSPVVRFWEQAGQARFAAELRATTAVFVALPRFDLGSPSGLQQFASHVQRVAEVCEARGGTVDKVLADEKGTSMLLVWGLPTMAHEDDALRATYAALDLHERFGEGSAPSIGIATGEVWCGVAGNERRAEYTLLGPSVNLAARAMVRAAGSILVCRVTAERVGSRVLLGPAQQHDLKGIAGATVLRAITGRAATATLRPVRRVVGRDTELAQIAAARDAVLSSGRASVVVVEAEPGFGKSSVLQAFADRESAAGSPVHWCAGSAEDALAQYLALRPLLRSALGADEDDRVVREQLVAACFDEGLSQRLPLLGEVLGIDLGSSDLANSVHGPARADNLHTLVANLLGRSLAPVTTYIVDDAHWLDASSWALLGVLTRTLPSILLVLGLRPGHSLAPDGAALLARSDNNHVRIGPLGPAAIAEVVCARLRIERVAPELLKVISSRAEGNPYIAEEVALALRDSGSITAQGVSATRGVSTGETFRLPPTVQGLVQARVDRLDAETQLFLKIGAVLGRTFNLRDIAALWPGAAPDVAAVAARAAARDLVDIEHGAPGTEVSFRHALAADAVYQGLLFAQRREFHGAAVRHFEARSDGELLLGRLAFHSAAAEDWVRAVRYHDEAGLAAFHKGANADCKRTLEQAARLADEHAVPVPAFRKATWSAALSEASIRLGSVADEIRHGLEVLDLVGQPLARSTGKRLLEVLRRVGRRVLSDRLPAVPADLDGPQVQLLDRVYARLLDGFGFAQDVGGFLSAGMRSLDLAEASGNAASAAITRLNLYFFLVYFPAAGLRARWLADVERTVTTLPDDVVRGRILSFLCAARWGLGDWDAAEIHGREALRVSHAVADVRSYCEANINLGHSLSSRGKLREAEWAFSAAREVARITGDRQSEGMAAMCGVWVSVQSGGLLSDTDLLDDFASFFEAEAIEANLLICDGIRARVAVELGRKELAEQCVDRCLLRAAKQTFPVPWQHAGLSAGWEAALLLGGPEAARRVRGFDRGLRTFAKLFPQASPSLSVLRVRTQVALGNGEAAARQARQCLKEAWVDRVPGQHLALRTVLTGSLVDEREAAEHLAVAERLRRNVVAGDGGTRTPTAFRVRSLSL